MQVVTCACGWRGHHPLLQPPLRRNWSLRSSPDTPQFWTTFEGPRDDAPHLIALLGPPIVPGHDPLAIDRNSLSQHGSCRAFHDFSDDIADVVLVSSVRHEHDCVMNGTDDFYAFSREGSASYPHNVGARRLHVPVEQRQRFGPVFLPTAILSHASSGVAHQHLPA